MVTFVAVVGVILLSTLVGSTISWAIARVVLGALEQAFPRPIPVIIPVDSSTSLTQRVS